MADMFQAFDDMAFDYHAFQIFWNSAYVDCGYWWEGYVSEGGGSSTGGGGFLRRR